MVRFCAALQGRSEKYGCYVDVENKKQMWAYNKGMQCDSVCIFSGTVNKG